MSRVIKDWLDRFLDSNSRTLSHPDGRHLYAYRMQKNEFDGLTTLLSACLKETQGTIQWLSGTERLFVLYAAEWSRRKYTGGAWRWDDISASLAWPSLSFEHQHDLTRKGMAYWKLVLHRNSSGSTAYLMSIATEGGFPVKLVERSDSHLAVSYVPFLMIMSCINRLA